MIPEPSPSSRSILRQDISWESATRPPCCGAPVRLAFGSARVLYPPRYTLAERVCMHGEHNEKRERRSLRFSDRGAREITISSSWLQKHTQMQACRKPLQTRHRTLRDTGSFHLTRRRTLQDSGPFSIQTRHKTLLVAPFIRTRHRTLQGIIPYVPPYTRQCIWVWEHSKHHRRPTARGVVYVHTSTIRALETEKRLHDPRKSSFLTPSVGDEYERNPGVFQSFQAPPRARQDFLSSHEHPVNVERLLLRWPVLQQVGGRTRAQGDERKD